MGSRLYFFTLKFVCKGVTVRYLNYLNRYLVMRKYADVTVLI